MNADLRESEKPSLNSHVLFLYLIRVYPRKSAAALGLLQRAQLLLLTDVSIRLGVSMKLSCQSSNMSSVQRSLR